MAQMFLAENLPSIIRASGTTITMAATNFGQSTYTRIGGQGYTLSSIATLNTATTGFNGLDTGSLAAGQLWYVYLVVTSAGVMGLTASLLEPATGPNSNAGYTSTSSNGAYRCVGRFLTSSVVDVSNICPLGSPLEEFAYTTGTWDADDTAAGYGFRGAAINSNLTTQRLKTVSWIVPAVSGDLVELEFSLDTANKLVWWKTSKSGGGSPSIQNGFLNSVTTFAAATTVGCFAAPNYSNNAQAYVWFGKYLGAALDGASLNNWTDGWGSADFYWRVKKVAHSNILK